MRKHRLGIQNGANWNCKAWEIAIRTSGTGTLVRARQSYRPTETSLCRPRAVCSVRSSGGRCLDSESVRSEPQRRNETVKRRIEVWHRNAAATLPSAGCRRSQTPEHKRGQKSHVDGDGNKTSCSILWIVLVVSLSLNLGVEGTYRTTVTFPASFLKYPCMPTSLLPLHFIFTPT